MLLLTTSGLYWILEDLRQSVSSLQRDDGPGVLNWLENAGYYLVRIQNPDQQSAWTVLLADALQQRFGIAWTNAAYILQRYMTLTTNREG